MQKDAAESLRRVCPSRGSPDGASARRSLRKNDGSLYDATDERRITNGELRDYVRDGGLSKPA